MIDQPSQKILEFCWTNNIKTLPINLRVQDGKKTYLSGEEGRFEDGRYNFKMTDFPKLTFKECKALTELYADETEWIAIDTNEIQQLDIDDPSWEFDSEAVQLGPFSCSSVRTSASPTSTASLRSVRTFSSEPKRERIVGAQPRCLAITMCCLGSGLSPNATKRYSTTTNRSPSRNYRRRNLRGGSYKQRNHQCRRTPTQ